jgi:1D-myo-inositol-tetrakisphosphate 5-kinase/inositol-polyphosphate multikinase
MGVYAKTLLVSQVGGHAGVSTSEDGSLIFKPSLAQEISFYQSVTSDPVFASLRPHIPKFYGTLRLEGKVEDGNLGVIHGPPKGEKDKYLHLEGHWKIARVFITAIHSIVLENLSHRFLKPNIIDVKLGTKLYDDEASEEKKARMIQAAKDTTSLETGVRLTGFQVTNMQWSTLGGFFVDFVYFCAILGV